MKALTLENIINHLQQNKGLLKENFGVIRIGVFGSFAEKQQTSQSDIDMAVEIEKSKKDIHSFLQLKRFLEKEFSRNVDLGFEHCLKPVVREKIREKNNICLKEIPGFIVKISWIQEELSWNLLLECLLKNFLKTEKPIRR
jgi:uncharacterized protein